MEPSLFVEGTFPFTGATDVYTDVHEVALDEECREMKALMGRLGSRGANYVEWTADKLYDVFFAYPQRPTPVDPGLILLSVGLSNVPLWGDLYDLYSGVIGYDPIPGWAWFAQLRGKYAKKTGKKHLTRVGIWVTIVPTIESATL